MSDSKLTLSERVQWVKDSGRDVVSSISGGKDSTAMALFIQENGIDKTNKVHYVYCDTKWEHPDLTDYIDNVIAPWLAPNFHRLINPKFPNGMTDLVKDRGMFPTRVRRMCTSDLKVKPIKDFIKALKEKGIDPINAVGIRAQESFRRSQMEEFEPGGPIGCDTWRPLFNYTFDDVVAIHDRHSMKPCSLYYRKDKPVKRVGCWPCILADKQTIRDFAEEDPEKVALIREMEKEFIPLAHVKAKASKAKKGEEYNPGFVAGGTFFNQGQAPYMRPIDETIKWAKTVRGGKQYPLFAGDEPFLPDNPSERGCGMWGLCDIPDEDGEFSP